MRPPASPLRSEMSGSSVMDAFLLLVHGIEPGRPRSTAPTPSTTSEHRRAVCLLYSVGELPPLQLPTAPKPPAELSCAPDLETVVDAVVINYVDDDPSSLSAELPDGGSLESDATPADYDYYPEGAYTTWSPPMTRSS
nr:uncharacterized protein LOC120974486 [Aegilops tauschii subsp. strangulata]